MAAPTSTTRAVGLVDTVIVDGVAPGTFLPKEEMEPEFASAPTSAGPPLLRVADGDVVEAEIKIQNHRTARPAERAIAAAPASATGPESGCAMTKVTYQVNCDLFVNRHIRASAPIMLSGKRL